MTKRIIEIAPGLRIAVLGPHHRQQKWAREPEGSMLILGCLGRADYTAAQLM